MCAYAQKRRAGFTINQQGEHHEEDENSMCANPDRACRLGRYWGVDMSTKRNLKRDQKFFSKSQWWEPYYVASRYARKDRKAVRTFIKQSAQVFYSTHDEVYALIEKELGLTRTK